LSESSEEYSGDEDERVPFFAMAQGLGIVPQDAAEIEELTQTVKPSIPPRPTVAKSAPTNWASEIDRLEARKVREAATIQMKDDSKTVSLSTSKVNYIDPRITAAWAKREGVPLPKLFNASLIKKFPWAMGIEEDYKF
jgi:DNA topoisomerase-1